MRKKRDSVLKPPPVYEIQYPNNININMAPNILESIRKMAKNIGNDNDNESKDRKEEKREIESLDFFTDGSCKPNPGPGGCAYYSPNFSIKSKIFVIDHDTSINYCELYGIKFVLQSVNNYIEFCKSNNNSCIKKLNYINIFTDSKFVCDILSINGYPKFNYYYGLINEIFVLSNVLLENNIQININKIKGHDGIEVMKIR